MVKRMNALLLAVAGALTVHAAYAAGGIKSCNKRYKVRFVEYDDQSQGGRVQQLYTRLVLQDKSQFLFSPYSSGLVATAAVISEQYGKIMLVGGGAEGKTYELGNKYLFQCITSADQYLAGAIDELKEHNPHAKVAFVYSDDPFSKAVVTAAREQAKRAGFTVALDESYPPSTTDFTAVINKVISSGADTFLGGGKRGYRALAMGTASPVQGRLRTDGGAVHRR